MTLPHARKPCRECPWRRDVPPGKFPPERYVALANTAYDMAGTVFACHATADAKPVACAGFVMRCHHNLRLRLRWRDLQDVSDGGYALFDTYREMAEANGVPPDHPALKGTR